VWLVAWRNGSYTVRRRGILDAPVPPDSLRHISTLRRLRLRAESRLPQARSLAIRRSTREVSLWIRTPFGLTNRESAITERTHGLACSWGFQPCARPCGTSVWRWVGSSRRRRRPSLQSEGNREGPQPVHGRIRPIGGDSAKGAGPALATVMYTHASYTTSSSTLDPCRPQGVRSLDRPPESDAVPRQYVVARQGPTVAEPGPDRACQQDHPSPNVAPLGFPAPPASAAACTASVPNSCASRP